MNNESPAQGLNVLVVDDDPAIARMLGRWLERAGYRVQTALDGVEALGRIETDCPDIVITDWEMPRLDGLGLCREVRLRNLPHYLYLVLLTVHSGPDQVVTGLEVGADDFLTKPVNQAELLARLRAGSRVVQLERRLSLMARTDSLTGLLTQRSFYEALRAEWERSRRYDLPLSCVMADIDFFKRVNDIHGHPAGDAVLRGTAELLRGGCRDSDLVCRYGGEEFCVLLPQTTEQEAVAWAERVRARLAATTFTVGNKPLRVTASFGAAQRCDDTQTWEQLVDLADQSLLTAKQSGRDRVVAYQSLNTTKDLHLDASEQADLFAGVAARHVMTPMVACLREEESVGAAVEFFLRMRINSTPVVDNQGILTGILSEKDLMAAMVSVNFWKLPVREVMKPNVVCYDEETPIRSIYEFLCRVTIRRVVITKGSCPTGTISRGTLLRWFRNLVLSRGLLLDPDAPVEPIDSDPFRSKQRLADTAGELARQATELEHRFDTETDDLVPFVVGGATRMQELVTDMLAYSRFAVSPPGTRTGFQTMMLEAGSVE